MVKLNIHALYSDLTVVYTLIVLCIYQQQSGIRRRITVDRQFIAYCVSYVREEVRKYGSLFYCYQITSHSEMPLHSLKVQTLATRWKHFHSATK